MFDEGILYTDGACLNNGSDDAIGGIGIYNQTHPELSISKSLDDCLSAFKIQDKIDVHTNNISELCAFIYAIKKFRNKYGKLIIYTDSSYIVNGLNKWIPMWKRRNWKNVKNVILWKSLDKLIKKNPHITYSHVKRNENKEADKLSRASI